MAVVAEPCARARCLHYLRNCLKIVYTIVYEVNNYEEIDTVAEHFTAIYVT